MKTSLALMGPSGYEVVSEGVMRVGEGNNGQAMTWCRALLPRR